MSHKWIAYQMPAGGGVPALRNMASFIVSEGKDRPDVAYISKGAPRQAVAMIEKAPQMRILLQECFVEMARLQYIHKLSGGKLGAPKPDLMHDVETLLSHIGPQ